MSYIMPTTLKNALGAFYVAPVLVRSSTNQHARHRSLNSGNYIERRDFVSEDMTEINVSWKKRYMVAQLQERETVMVKTCHILKVQGGECNQYSRGIQQDR